MSDEVKEIKGTASFSFTEGSCVNCGEYADINYIYKPKTDTDKAVITCSECTKGYFLALYRSGIV